MNTEESLQKLFSLHTFGIKLGLNNINLFLEHLANPQKKIKTIHVAGSNGKGSTASFIASILMEAGFKTGLYTSPHFVKFNERIVINKKQIDDTFVAEFINRNVKFIDEHQLTFFEVTTAMAFEYFNKNNTEYCVIETGLGGRLDATNVLNPLAVVITSISLEHTNILGTSISQIAEEKAAIIKSGAKVFTGKLTSEAEIVVKNKSEEQNCELFKLDDYINERDDVIELYTDEIEIDDFAIPLKGRYQKFNAALAGLVVSKTFSTDNPHHIQSGIKNLLNNVDLQGRYEFLSKEPTIILDSAHNQDGIINFLGEFEKDESKYTKKSLLFAVMKDKAIPVMLSELAKHFDEIFITEIDYERCAKIEDIQLICEQMQINTKPITNIKQFIENFETAEKSECLVILGSMFLIGKVKEEITVIKNLTF
jgi:dihydrofolate synthase / folylpolyglutamate synthase